MVYQSLQSITEDRQSWGSGRIYTDYYTAPTITNRHEKKLTNPLCSGGVLVSVVAVLAAAACDSVVTHAQLRVLTVTVCLSLYPTTTTQRLCCFFRATLPGLFWYVVADPICV